MWIKTNLFLVLLCLVLYSDALPQTTSQTYSRKGKFDKLEETVGQEEAEKDARPANGEPTCKELRMMWQFSKRQSRAPEITNEIPTYRDPFAVNIWDDYARPRSAGRVKLPHPRKVVFGKIMGAPPKTPERIKAFQDIVANRELLSNREPPRKMHYHRHSGGGLAGLQSLSSGSFQHLKELIRNERARELQEQRMSDDANKDPSKYPYGRVNDSPPSVDNVIIRNKPPVSRARMAGYPAEIYVPGYFEGYPYPNQQPVVNKYKPQFSEPSLVSLLIF